MMDPFAVTVIVLPGAFSAFFIYKLLSSKRSAFEKSVYCVVLLVPVVGPLLYLFLSEEVPPQPPLLRNNGPRGAYTDTMIAIQAALEETARQKAEASADEAVPRNDDDAELRP